MGLKYWEHHLFSLHRPRGRVLLCDQFCALGNSIHLSEPQRTGLDSDYLTLSLPANLLLSRAIPLLSWESMLNKERVHKEVDNNDLNDHKTSYNLHCFKIILATLLCMYVYVCMFMYVFIYYRGEEIQRGVEMNRVHRNNIFLAI